MSGLLSKQNFLRAIREMDPYRFEEFIADVWEQRGFETTVRKQSGDRGIDIIAENGHEKHLLQVKRYNSSNKIGSEEVRKYATLYQQVDDANHVQLVTSGYYTEQALQLARDLSVGTTNGEQLFETVNSHAPEVAIDYLHSSKPDDPVEKTSPPSPNKDPTDNVSTVLTCPNCGDEITDNEQSYVDHWVDCRLPDNRPSEISVDTWWNIKDEVTDNNKTGSSEEFDTWSPEDHRPTETANSDQSIEQSDVVMAIFGLAVGLVGLQRFTQATGLARGFFLLVVISGIFLLFASYVNVNGDFEN
jgi:hypothetical protein